MLRFAEMEGRFGWLCSRRRAHGYRGKETIEHVLYEEITWV